MRTFKRIALLAAVAALCVAAMAQAASAVTVSPASSAYTFTTGVTRFATAGGNVSCATSTVRGVTPASGGTGNVTVTFDAPCTGPAGGATVTCKSPWTLTIGNVSGTTAPTTLTVPQNACTITAANPFGNCTIIAPTNNGGITVPDTMHLGTGGVVIDDTVSSTTMSFTDSGGFGCPASGTSTMGNSSGGAMVYTQSGGTAISVS